MSESRKPLIAYTSSLWEITATSVTNNSSAITATSVMNNSSAISVPEGCLTLQLFPFIPWDNPDNIIPKEVDNIINLLFNGICLPLLFVVSFVTNIINMVVFYKHGLKERINACLFTLSLVDLLSVTVVFSYASDVLHMFIAGKEDEAGPSMQFFIRTHLVGLHGVLWASQMVYTVIALERCLCITRPLLARRFMPTKATVVILWSMVLVITGQGAFVIAVQYGVLCLFDTRDNTVSYVSFPTDFYFRHRNVVDLWNSVLNGFLIPGVSFICVTVCTLVSAVQLKKLSRWRETASSSASGSSVSSRDMAITRVIIGTSMLFIACSVPAIVISFSSLSLADLQIGGRHENLAWVIRRCYQLSTAVNSTFNFFIYYGCGTKFRETTRGLFMFTCCRGDGGGTNGKAKRLAK